MDGLTRRGFIRRAGLLGVVAGVPSLLSGCSGETVPQSGLVQAKSERPTEALIEELRGQGWDPGSPQSMADFVIATREKLLPDGVIDTEWTTTGARQAELSNEASDVNTLLSKFGAGIPSLGVVTGRLVPATIVVGVRRIDFQVVVGRTLPGGPDVGSVIPMHEAGSGVVALTGDTTIGVGISSILGLPFETPLEPGAEDFERLFIYESGTSRVLPFVGAMFVVGFQIRIPDTAQESAGWIDPGSLIQAVGSFKGAGENGPLDNLLPVDEAFDGTLSTTPPASSIGQAAQRRSLV